jgi:GTP-binding protein HflX
VEELVKLVKETEADKVIFDNRLRPRQSYNLAKVTNVEVIDRFQLILEIFKQRATTTEAQEQIRLAELQLERAQAKEKVRLAKRGEQPGFMGLGAYEVDIYYESVKKEIHAIRRRLKKIRGKRVLHRERRAKMDFSSISLAGYTKAGKSSLFNILAQEQVPVDTALFTTLSTTTRMIQISNEKFLLTDTVGFIDRLPLILIEAFHSTLEETIYSDLVLLMIDASEPLTRIEKKLRICIETMEKIGASGIPIITVLNKIDLLSDKEAKEKLGILEDETSNPVPISALNGTNIETLKKEILKMLGNYVRASLTIPMTNETMSLISWLYEAADVQTVEYVENSAQIVLEASPTVVEKIKSRVEGFNGKLKKLSRDEKRS